MKLILGILIMTSISTYATDVSRSYLRFASAVQSSEIKKIISEHATDQAFESTWTEFRGMIENYDNVPDQEDGEPRQMQGQRAYDLSFSVHSNGQNYGLELSRCKMTIIHKYITDGSVEIVKPYTCKKTNL